MKKILLLIACFCFVVINPIIAQADAGPKTVQTEEKVHACCKAKGGAENCCKKGMSPEKKQCSKKDCKGACCSKALEANSNTKCSKSKCDKSQCDKSKCDKSKCATSCSKNAGESEKKSWWKVW